MKIAVEDIPEEGLSLDFKEEGESLHINEKELSFLSPVKVALKLTRNKEKVLVSGKIEVEVRLTCSRCLELCQYSASAPIELTYSPSLPCLEGDVELREEDFKIAYYREGIINFRDDVRQSIILALPVKPLCRPRCRGLCPHCGQNLNESKCSCQEKIVDPRLAKLGKLLENK